jgi:hypothetical protein
MGILTTSQDIVLSLGFRVRLPMIQLCTRRDLLHRVGTTPYQWQFRVHQNLSVDERETPGECGIVVVA